MKTITFNFDRFKSDGETFMRALTARLQAVGVPAQSLESDHLCFRVATDDEYAFFKKALEDHGTLLTEAIVNGRPIATFRLTAPFTTDVHEVWLLELPAPKSGTFNTTGFEHAEFLVNQSFVDIRAKYPHLSFSEGGNPILNPELGISLADGLTAKFHHQSLERVIELEEAVIQDVVFDFDGTIIKSRDHIYEINRIVFSKALEREVSLQESIENFHPEFSKLFQAFSVACPHKQNEAIANWGSVASQFSYELFDGVVETLHELKSCGVCLHLWTARDEESARTILKEHKIEDVFTTLSFATHSDSKPHASSLCFEWKAAPKNSVVVIGDSASDIIGAKNISAIAAAALWDSHAKKSTVVHAGADLFFSNVSDLRKWVISSRQTAHEH